VSPIVELRNVSKSFGSVLALNDLNFDVEAGEVHCLLGDNGAGKSTLIKVLAGVHRVTSGEYLIDGAPTTIDSPRAALDLGIATVYQDLAMVPLMSITRNFFLGRELMKGRGLLRGSTSLQPTGSSSENSPISASTSATPARPSARYPEANVNASPSREPFISGRVC
jgi:ABC-type sugar transport system ATPase subunit